MLLSLDSSGQCLGSAVYKISAREIGPAQISPIYIRLVKIGLYELSSAQPGRIKLGIANSGGAEVSLEEIGANQNGR